LPAEHLTVNLGNLDALELGHISTFLLGEAATLPVRGFGALSPRNGLAFFLLHSFALPLLDVIAFLLGNIVALLLRCISALLGGHITALLGVSNLLADLLGHWVALSSINSLAFLAIDGLALTAINIPAFLLWDLGALPVTDNTTLLGRNVFADLVLNSATLLLVDHLTFSHSICCAFFLINRAALVLERGTALLIILSRTLLFMDSLMNSSWHIDALQLGNIVTLLILNSGTLLPGILSCLAFFPVLNTAFLARDSLLDRPLSDLTLALLNISTDGVRNISAFLLGDRFVGRLWDFIANFLGNLTTNWLRRRCNSLDWRRVKLKRQIRDG